MYQNWFSDSVLAEELFARLRTGVQGCEMPFLKNAERDAMLVGGGVFFVTGAITGLFAFGPGDPTVTQQLIAAGLTLAATAIAYCITLCCMGSNNKIYLQRVESFNQLAESHNLNTCGYQKLDDIYGLPWFHSETPEIDLQKKSLYSIICGEWEGAELAWLEGKHLIDPMVRGSDSLVKSLAAGMVVKRRNRLRLKSFDAIVFSEKLDLPDIVIGHHSVPQVGYIKNDLKNTTSYELPGANENGLWAAASDCHGCEGVFSPTMVNIINSRPCLVQVIDGRCVVFTNFFQTGDHSSAASSVAQISEELNFARAAFEMLSEAAATQNGGNTAKKAVLETAQPEIPSAQIQSTFVSDKVTIETAAFGAEQEDQAQPIPAVIPESPLSSLSDLHQPIATAQPTLRAQPKKQPTSPQIIFGAIIAMAGILAIASSFFMLLLPQAEVMGGAFFILGIVMIAMGVASDKAQNAMQHSRTYR